MGPLLKAQGAREGVAEIKGRSYAYKFHFGLKSIRLRNPELYEDWFWSTATGNFDEAPAFVRRHLAV